MLLADDRPTDWRPARHLRARSAPAPIAIFAEPTRLPKTHHQSSFSTTRSPSCRQYLLLETRVQDHVGHATSPMGRSVHVPAAQCECPLDELRSVNVQLARTGKEVAHFSGRPAWHCQRPHVALELLNDGMFLIAASSYLPNMHPGVSMAGNGRVEEGQLVFRLRPSPYQGFPVVPQ